MCCCVGLRLASEAIYGWLCERMEAMPDIATVHGRDPAVGSSERDSDAHQGKVFLL